MERQGNAAGAAQRERLASELTRSAGPATPPGASRQSPR
jgi:hypothetical protein